LVKPYSVGRVELASAEPEAAPRIFLNLFDHPEDLQRMVTGIKLTRDVYRAPALAPFVGDEIWPGPVAQDDAAIAEAILAAPTTYSHASCTCAMGPEGARWAVVDQLGKLHGLDGLHVVDASIMPAIPSVPTNMTTIMIAERCADGLRAGLSAGFAAAAAA
jgi:choline dehydrogenase